MLHFMTVPSDRVILLRWPCTWNMKACATWLASSYPGDFNMDFNTGGTFDTSWCATALTAAVGWRWRVCRLSCSSSSSWSSRRTFFQLDTIKVAQRWCASPQRLCLPTWKELSLFITERVKCQRGIWDNPTLLTLVQIYCIEVYCTEVYRGDNAIWNTCGDWDNQGVLPAHLGLGHLLARSR